MSITFQIAISFGLWLLVAFAMGRRSRTAGPSKLSQGAAGCYAGLLFLLSAAVLFGGLVWIAQAAPAHPKQLGPGIWLAITGLGGLFTAGQAEAAGLILRAMRRAPAETENSSDSSESLAHHNSEQ